MPTFCCATAKKGVTVIHSHLVHARRSYDMTDAANIDWSTWNIIDSKCDINALTSDIYPKCCINFTCRMMAHACTRRSCRLIKYAATVMFHRFVCYQFTGFWYVCGCKAIWMGGEWDTCGALYTENGWNEFASRETTTKTKNLISKWTKMKPETYFLRAFELQGVKSSDGNCDTVGIAIITQ